METDVELCDLAAPAFRHALPALLEIYTAAMDPPREQLTGRRTIMEQHARNPRFTSVVALAPSGSAVGFGYGFHGQSGQWWHDVVTSGLRTRAPGAERRWFADSFEIAELHVLPESQRRGIGRRLLERLTAARRERTAVLSTYTGPTAAHGLYTAYGFTDVLTEFYFPGSPYQPYTIMAARLPLRERGGQRPARRARAWPWTG
ncbi:ribosomal protein S18 acetylase RimI-like enzyme [Lipingzhangella halophila]|uniref:Ribosomal protein S18 acetylase RimI-like enzyme n=1 Tax=Lipingzhangella halophila TaxID=1783352 RepID=A0A7W7W1Z5_9ACTN|nr:GNAT family N-acetyltransferase [Lipingzhangella halophila]MBB4930853.1 ribosomal protein S18 acetylase RimI-like enzyme [Lipingzhangella halophila]